LSTSRSTTTLHPSRRQVLKSLSALGAAGVMGSTVRELLAAPTAKSTVKGGRIDVHHHHIPPPQRPAGSLHSTWTPELTLEMMDKFDIGVSILSMTQMGDILYDNTEKGRLAVRAGNDYGAKLMAEHPKRFGLFVGIPFPDLDGSLKEIEYGLDTLKADGIGIYTNDNQGRWPGDPYFEPMWQELNRRKTIVYTHPLAPKCCSKLDDGVPASMDEYDFDTTRACTSLLANGVLHRYPDVKFILSHSGGTMPVLSQRIKDRYPKDAKHQEYIPNGVIPELQKFYVDIAHASFPAPMAALLKFANPDHIMFGTDYPAEPIETTVDQLAGLGLSPELAKAIDRGNAERLFPRFKLT
jgi:6-methylsalicylate decarboxylase